MQNQSSYIKSTGWLTILSGVVALIIYVLVAASVNFNLILAPVWAITIGFFILKRSFAGSRTP